MITEEKLIKTLNKLDTKPSNEWANRVVQKIQSDIFNVTKEPQQRNTFSSLFNFLSFFYMSPKYKLFLTLGIVFVLLVTSGGVAYASDDALPGDLLYPVDKAVESINRVIISDPIAKAEFEVQVLDERVSELENLSEDVESESVGDANEEVEAQKNRVRERLEVLAELSVQNKLNTQEQQQLMQEVQNKLQVHEESMNQIKTNLENKGDVDNSQKLTEIKNQYSEEIGGEINKYESESGVQLNESEMENNQGDDTQIQNQNQNEVQNDDNDNGNGLDGGSGSSSGGRN
ncbi:hypothetical protein KC675_05050 [Candidatus Dojkabacteria bacterium]|uniref:DUF5667 domain-containing protein n=1 Tax=Candidatus Dojkabacteria bacterium TaxID=2099670 RepID=A0A955IEJ6_9BACT|nr:hypothetical protein [Candidatus Dojkabacteria bacterium]